MGERAAARVGDARRLARTRVVGRELEVAEVAAPAVGIVLEPAAATGALGRAAPWFPAVMS